MALTCWSCGQGRAPHQLLCPACGKVQPPPPRVAGQRLVENHFELLGLPAGFDLDASALDAAYRAWSRKLHPDRFAKASAQERRFSLEQTTRLNAAYRALKDPVRRAEHLLSLFGVDLSEPVRKPGQPAAFQMPPEFLEQALEDREKLLEAKTSGDEGAVAALAEGVRRERDAALAEVSAGLRELGPVPPVPPQAPGPSAQRLALLLFRLRYFARYLDEVEGRDPEL